MTANQPANQRVIGLLPRLVPACLFVLTFALYASTAAPGTLFGDLFERHALSYTTVRTVDTKHFCHLDTFFRDTSVCFFNQLLN